MTNYQIGCFSRPWNKLEWEDFVAGVAGAGYEYMGFMRHGGELTVKPGMTDEEITALKESLSKHNLKPSTCLAAHNLGQGVDAAVQEACEHVDAMEAVGVEYYLSCGTSDEAQYETLYAVLKQLAAHGETKGVTVTLKPHGGVSATSLDLLRAVERVDHPNFGIYFDPGNILYYTGGSPLENLDKLAPHVVGICIKDEAGGEKGDVNIEPGTADVDFEAVFSILKAGGFGGGPVLVECLGGEELADINQRAARVRERIEQWVQ